MKLRDCKPGMRIVRECDRDGYFFELRDVQVFDGDVVHGTGWWSHISGWKAWGGFGSDAESVVHLLDVEAVKRGQGVLFDGEA